MKDELEFNVDFEQKNVEKFLLLQLLLTWGVGLLALSGIAALLIFLVKLFLS